MACSIPSSILTSTPTSSISTSILSIQCPRIRYILSGSFNSPNLHLLSYDTTSHDLVIQKSILAKGPHQFLALGQGKGNTKSGKNRRIYATTWAMPPKISAWDVVGLESNEGKDAEIRFINEKHITATSSYVFVYPPPFTSLTSPSYNLLSKPSISTSNSNSNHSLKYDPIPISGTAEYLYSAGGPTGEIHSLDSETGALGEKLQEIVFLKGGEKDLKNADKTRKALRYGSHNVDIGPNHLTFIADLGRNSILVYKHDPSTGLLGFVSECQSPREGDGPRHVVPSPDGKWVFSITEHTSYLDVFSIDENYRLYHVQSASVIPEGLDRHKYRGDTVRISPSGLSIHATTRGMTSKTKGFITSWSLNLSSSNLQGPLISPNEPLNIYTTLTSGGKANAIEWAPRYVDLESEKRSDFQQSLEIERNRIEKDFLVLTDDEQGYVMVMEWDGNDLKEMARTKLPGKSEDGEDEGASHAIWLS